MLNRENATSKARRLIDAARAALKMGDAEEAARLMGEAIKALDQSRYDTKIRSKP